MKSVLGIIGINLLVLLVALVLVELLFGAWVRHDSLNRLNIVRDRQVQFSTAHLYDSATGVSNYTRDKYGLRGNFRQPAEITVLTVGGSTTDQRYVSDELTWQAVLQRELAAAGKLVVFGNAGVDGQSTVGHLKSFEWWFPLIPGLKPEYIIFYVGINDFYRQSEVDYDDLRTSRDKRTLRQLLREYSALYHLTYTIYGVYQTKVRHRAGHGKVDFTTMQWTTAPLRDDHSALMITTLQQYRPRLQLLIEQTRALGAVPIFVTQPTHWYRIKNGQSEGAAEITHFAGAKINGVDRHLMMRLLDAATCEVAAGNGLLCIDIGATENWKDEDFYDFTHMTPSGAEKLGKKMAASLLGVF